MLASGSVQAMPPLIGASQAGSTGESYLTFMCGSDGSMWLDISGMREGWGRDPGPEIAIGRQRFRMRAIVVHDTLLLSDLRAPAKGVSQRLVSAAKVGRPIEMVGFAGKELSLGMRAYRVANARAAIEDVEKSCGLTPSR